MRIVSLVPSLTELLYDLGLGDSVVGRTRFCVHPSSKVDDAAIIGGTKNPIPEKIHGLKPDLVIANYEENRREDVEDIRTFSEVLVTDISGVQQALEAITIIGEKTGKEREAVKIRTDIEALIPSEGSFPKLRAAYLIWEKPCMTVGGDTYIHDVMRIWGLENVFGARTRYPEISGDDLRSESPEVLMLSSEPYPFQDKHVRQYEELLPDTVPVLVNGEFFSWYGSRMRKAFTWLNSWRAGLKELTA